MPGPDAGPHPLDEADFDAGLASLNLTLSDAERARALVVASFLNEAAVRLRMWADLDDRE